MIFFVSLQSNNSKEIVMNDTVLLTDKRVFYNPSRYLKFLQKNKELIVSVKVIPAKLGEKGFGRIEVETNKSFSYGKQSFAGFQRKFKKYR